MIATEKSLVVARGPGLVCFWAVDMAVGTALLLHFDFLSGESCPPARRRPENPQEQRQRSDPGKQKRHYPADKGRIGDRYHQSNVKPGYRDNIHGNFSARALGCMPFAQPESSVPKIRGPCGARVLCTIVDENNRIMEAV